MNSSYLKLNGGVRGGLLVTLAVATLLAVSCTLFLVSSDARGMTSNREVDEDSDGAPYAAGELLVTFKPDVPLGRVEKVQEETGAKGEEEEIPNLDARLLTFPKVESEASGDVREEVLLRKKNELEADPRVESVDFNYLRKPSYVPNDPRFPTQYGLSRARFTKAWNRTRGGGVRIAIIDGGVDTRHPDLRSKIVAQKDFVTGDPVAEDSLGGHGTINAGIAAAVTNNGKGVAGGCPNCKLLVAKVLDRYGGYDSDVANGIVWSVDRGAKVVNLSLGGEGSSRVLKDAVDYATNKGAVVVASAGNYAEYGNPRIYPAAYPNAIAVAATDSQDRRAYFSERGNWVDVAAPGVDILSTLPGGRYGKMSGTSMAAPYVSGLSGLLAAQGLTNSQVKGRIESRATDLGPRGKDPYYGYGRINAQAAVNGVNSHRVIKRTTRRASSGAWGVSKTRLVSKTREVKHGRS